ncbi:MAG: excinuclease ABC subunit UvrC [Candidatus Dojkabacteria bacterium]|nr:MAG: excinuclease ABC subunit UvrC [Candidatus Dojkabacteria bacterium]
MQPDIELKKQLDLLPNRVGVYKFYDSEDTLLYVGKAVNLYARVSSYFRDDHFDRPHIIPMIPKIIRIDYIETENEIEALVLESALIKNNQPRYNVLQKDDKSYAWLYITTQEEIPKIYIVRSTSIESLKKGKLFGPYPSGRAVRQVYRYIRKLHPFCTCNSPTKPCLYYHLGMCINPAFGEHTVEEYRNNIDEIIKFLDGRKKRHVTDLERQMREFSSNREFEKAALLRDKIEDLKHLGNKIDVGYSGAEEEYIENRNKMLRNELDGISKQLGLAQVSRVECYDISNIQGTFSYGSMVVSEEGVTDPKQYRVFKVKSVEGSDDFASLREVLTRRLKHIDTNVEDESLSTKPDIIMIDGGKGQLSAVIDLIPDDIFLLGISKGRKYKRKGGRKVDEFWVVRNRVTLQIPLKKPRILVTLRDEAHRFALKHHRKARKAYMEKSLLDSVKGIGPKKKKLLMKEYGSVKTMWEAGPDSVRSVLKDQKLVDALFIELKKRYGSN